MPKYDDFDLDLQTKKLGNTVTIAVSFDTCATSVDAPCPTDDCYSDGCYTYGVSCDTNCTIASYDVC